MWGSATLAMAVSSNSMNVASVTTTATIQGLIAGRSAATYETGMEAAAELIQVPAPLLVQKETVRSHLNFSNMAISDQWVAELIFRYLHEQRRADARTNNR